MIPLSNTGENNIHMTYTIRLLTRMQTQSLSDYISKYKVYY